MFQWGYEGWGGSTKTLVRAVDEVERDRGHQPPIFVDVRYSRSVRAVGFRDHAFERLLGHARYRWMRSLGNAAIGTRRRKMRIQCPDAAHQLLDLAIDAAAANRRVIFFCSCGSPHAAADCHRAKVTKLLLAAARRRGVRIEVVEWPGGLPSRNVIRIPANDRQLHKVRNGANALALRPRQASTVGGVPWGTIVELTSSKDRQVLSAGPPQYRAGRWYLPIFLVPVEEGDSAALLKPHADRWRARSNLNALRT